MQAHPLSFFPSIRQTAASILLLGAHCPDIEIGCGATVMRLAARHPAARFTGVAFSAGGSSE
jgi:LmbE family N-acetylglucosaminyl deacetylase